MYAHKHTHTHTYTYRYKDTSKHIIVYMYAWWCAYAWGCAYAGVSVYARAGVRLFADTCIIFWETRLCRRCRAPRAV